MNQYGFYLKIDKVFVVNLLREKHDEESKLNTTFLNYKKYIDE